MEWCYHLNSRSVAPNVFEERSICAFNVTVPPGDKSTIPDPKTGVSACHRID
jgi:hypothetical protein